MKRGHAIAGVFAVVLAAELALVAAAGTDMPFLDQWDSEGRWLFPAWVDGSWSIAQWLQPHNEHRILWTNLLNLGLFTANGQWDPLLELVASAGVRAAAAAALAGWLTRGTNGRAMVLTAAGVAVAFLPHLAWHNVLWGFQSQFAFVLGFSLLALGWLGGTEPTPRQTAAGLLAGIAALLAMGSGALVPASLLGLALVRAVETRRWETLTPRRLWPVLVLFVLALAGSAAFSGQGTLGANNAEEFGQAALRLLAWPHAAPLLGALLLNLPVAVAVAGRLGRRRQAGENEDFVLLVWGWAAATVLATAWARGGGGELDNGVPSRYADFVVLLPLANAWFMVRLAREARGRFVRAARVGALTWAGFLLIGWLALSTMMVRRVILPRVRDREAPVRLALAFQATGDARVFDGQPMLLVPHPNSEAVAEVLHDPRLRGKLPPSLQPEHPLGPGSRVVRALLGRPTNGKSQ